MLAFMMTTVIAPLFVGLVIELVSHWLADRDDK